MGAYTQGATGLGAKIAIIDSGVNAASAELAGRIDPASTGAAPVDNHGTSVATIAAGARNGAGSLGIAFDSTILSINTLTCTAGDCFHRLDTVAAAIDYSVGHYADVINLSMVGPTSNPSVVSAIDAATRAGTVVVIAAGNSGATNPDGFAMQNTEGANGALIIAGSYTGTTLNSSAAGRGSPYFLAAYGGSTSASTPVISGAAALLAAAFPNLTGSQIVEILFESADDAGTPGVDSVWGQGILNIGRAFQPSGALAFAGTSQPLLPMAGGRATGPLGDFWRRTGPSAIVLDRFSRAYSVNVTTAFGSSWTDSPLSQSVLALPRQTHSMAAGPLSLQISISGKGSPSLQPHESVGDPSGYGHPEQALQATAFAAFKPRAGTVVAFASGVGANGIRDGLLGGAKPFFVTDRDGAAGMGPIQFDLNAAGVLQDFGGLRLLATADRGKARTGVQESVDYSSADLTVEKLVGPARFRVGAKQVVENGSILGATFGEAFRTSQATTIFADVAAHLRLPDRWSVGGSYRRGWTSAHGATGMLAQGKLTSSAYSLELTKAGLALPGDFLAVRLAQPLRVTKGGLLLELPIHFDHSTGQAEFGRRRLSLAPVGRELDLEASYGRYVLGGFLSLNAYARKDVGNIASGRDDFGGLFRFTTLH